MEIQGGGDSVLSVKRSYTPHTVNAVRKGTGW